MSRLLVVDDEPRILQGLENMFFVKAPDWEATFVSEPARAADLLATDEFGALLTDMRMPGMSGAQVLEHAKSVQPATIRIALTGEVDLATAGVAVPCSHRFLSKPCPSARLLETLAWADGLLRGELVPGLLGIAGGLSALPAMPATVAAVGDLMLAEAGLDDLAAAESARRRVSAMNARANAAAAAAGPADPDLALALRVRRLANDALCLGDEAAALFPQEHRLSALLLRLWQLPEVVAAAIERQDEPELAEGAARDLAIRLNAIAGVTAVSPLAFSRAGQVREAVLHAAKKLDVAVGWELPLAALLARIGWAVLPSELVERYLTGDALTADEQRKFNEVPETSARLIRSIPRLDGVAELIRASGTGSTRSGAPAIIAAAEDLVVLLGRGKPMTLAIGELEDVHDRAILAGFQGLARPGDAAVSRSVKAAQIESGMTVIEDVRTTKGSVLVRAGTELSPALAEQVRGFASTVGIFEPIKVRASR